ncbi:MAG: hypothetical protein AAFX79_00550 [Planctomycetota bacterium]
MPDDRIQAGRAGRLATIDAGVSVWDQWGAVPPPPKLPSTATGDAGPSAAAAPPVAAPQPVPDPAAAEPMGEPGDDAASPDAVTAAPTFHDFDAEVDLAELDDRIRPVTTWSARATSVSRSAMSIRSRRMCYRDKVLLIAVHLIDDKPVVLAGRVASCDYGGDGLYLVELDLMPKPESDEVRAWEHER